MTDQTALVPPKFIAPSALTFEQPFDRMDLLDLDQPIDHPAIQMVAHRRRQGCMVAAGRLQVVPGGIASIGRIDADDEHRPGLGGTIGGAAVDRSRRPIRAEVQNLGT